MKTLPVALSLALCTCLVSTSVHGADPQDTWMKLIVGKWSAEGTDGRKWEVEVKPLLDGKALTVAVANDDGTSGAGLIGWEPDTKKLVETGYGSDGGYWHLTYTSVTDHELRGQRTALMADGTKQIGNWHVWKEGNDIVHWSFDGKDGKGQEVKFTGKHTRNTEDSAKEAIVRIEKQWAKAMLDGDAEWFKKMLTDDFRIVLPEGQVWNRAEFADAWATGTFNCSKCDILELDVRIHGDVAIVIGRGDMAGKADGEEFAHIEQWTDVYVKTDGKWKCLSCHVTSSE